MRIHWSPLALSKVDGIVDHIARDRPMAAERWAVGVFDLVERLARSPKRGRVVPEAGREEIRELLYGQYRIIYRVASALELSRRLIRNELPHRPLLDRPGLVARYAAASYRSPDQQVLGPLPAGPFSWTPAATCPGGRPRSDVEIFRGTLTSATVEPRAVFHRALAASAASVIVFQTRTSGDPVPTREDWSFTHRLVEAGEILGIGVRDHLLVTSAEQWVVDDGGFEI